MVLNVLVRCFAIGVVAGLRSMTAPAATLAAADSHWAGPARFAATGELAVDKLPIAPSRLMPGPLAARVLSGTICGRTLARRAHGSAPLGMLTGAVGALAGSYGGYHVRHFMTATWKLPDFPLALVEDSLAVGLARLATTR